MCEVERDDICELLSVAERSTGFCLSRMYADELDAVTRLSNNEKRLEDIKILLNLVEKADKYNLCYINPRELDTYNRVKEAIS